MARLGKCLTKAKIKFKEKMFNEKTICVFTCGGNGCYIYFANRNSGGDNHY
jgi:hypothetical protein